MTEETFCLPGGFLTLHLSPPSLCPWGSLLVPHLPDPLRRGKRKTSLGIRAFLSSTGEVEILSPFGKQRVHPKTAPVLITHLIHRLIAKLSPPGTLHGALVGTSHSALILLGESGTGKTTLVREFLKIRLPVGSDEFLALGQGGVLSFPRAIEWEGDPPALPGDFFSFPEYDYYLFQPYLAPLFFVPFERVRAVIVLERDRAGPILLPLSSFPRESWLRWPSISQFFSLVRFLRIPLFSLYPGTPEESRDRILSLLG